MVKLAQVSFSSGEVSPSLHSRVDMQKFTSALKECRNFFVRPQGGVSNRQGTEFIYALNPDSNAVLFPFIRSEDDAYMLVAQEENIKVFRDGAYVSGTARTITGITYSTIVIGFEVVPIFTVTTSVAHTFSAADSIVISGVVSTWTTNTINSSRNIYDTPTATTFRFLGDALESGSYTSGGTATKALTLATPFQSDELSSVRYTQSADVMTLVHQGYFPSEVTRTGATTFSYATISDIDTGPFLDINETATTITASAATGTGITLTASSSIFTANHVGALIIIYIEDLSAVPPWEAAKSVTAGNLRLSNGKVYEAANTATTGTIAPNHDEGSQFDGGGNVEWDYLHSLYGIARITAQAGTTATADVIYRLPIVSPATSTKWAFGAWSEDQGYPGVVTYYADRLVFARTLEQPQTQWASKTGDYHNFLKSSPIVADDSITQTLNSRQTNAIVEMLPMEQLISTTANSAWASPNRGESWSPETVGFFLQNNTGAADQRAVVVGERAIFAERFGTRLRDLSFGQDRDKFGGNELTVLARHLFEDGNIVDMDYAEYPDGILWIVRSDGALIGLTYLPEQEVIAFHRHDTNGYFERVCVIPEDGRDAVYFVVRRTLGNGSEARYLERLSSRSNDEIDAFYVDSGLSYDGRNTTATTITVTGTSYDGGDEVTLTASASLFASTDIGDAIQFGSVHVLITAYTSATVVTGQLQSPLGVDLQGVATSTWTLARDTFSNLGHLEGLLVTGLADGNVIDPDDTTTDGVVSSGQLVLSYPAGVVHIGLAYTQQVKTLTMNIPGGAQIRDNAKCVSKVSIVTESTTGLSVGPDEDHLDEIPPRAFENYTEPNSLITGTQSAYLQSTWDKDSSITIRQAYPKPATILAVIPTVTVGNNG